jgi:tight adherence protein C
VTVDQILYLTLIFIAVTAAAMSIGFVLTQGDALRSRLKGLAGRSALEEPAPLSEWTETVLRMAKPVARLSAPTADQEISRLRARFMHAGFRQPSAPIFFLAAKTALVVLLPLAFLILERSGFVRLEGSAPVVLMLLFAAIGYYLPNVVLAHLTRRRQREIFEAFPDAIDMMIVCVEAGLGLDMAINRAAEEMKLRSPELTEELDLVALELRVGASRDRALRNFATRTGLDEVSTFVSMLLQADRFGTSLAESLRVHADTMRTRRRLRAEEAAAKIPLKLLFPLIFFIFPSLLVVLMGPAMIQIYRVLLPTFAGTQ